MYRFFSIENRLLWQVGPCMFSGENTVGGHCSRVVTKVKVFGNNVHYEYL